MEVVGSFEGSPLVMKPSIVDDGAFYIDLACSQGTIEFRYPFTTSGLLLYRVLVSEAFRVPPCPTVSWWMASRERIPTWRLAPLANTLWQ